MGSERLTEQDQPTSGTSRGPIFTVEEQKRIAYQSNPQKPKPAPVNMSTQPAVLVVSYPSTTPSGSSTKFNMD